LQGTLRSSLGVVSVRSERSLGIDQSSGRKASRLVRKTRLKDGNERVARMRAVLRARRKARGIVARTGLLPAVGFGIAVTGLNDSELHALRSQVFKAVEARTAAKSRTLALMLMPNKYVDPIYAASVEPVVMLVRALWEQWLPRNVLSDCLAWNIANVRSWSQARGPLAAALLSLRRIGWEMLSPSLWRTRKGTCFDPCTAGPWVVRKLIQRDGEGWQWDRIAASVEHPELQRLKFGGVLHPLRRLLGLEAGSPSPLTSKRKAYLRSVVVNGQWPMARLHQHGYAVQPGCKCCGEEGTLVHRHTVCYVRRCGRSAPNVVVEAAEQVEIMPEARVLLERCLWPAVQVQRAAVVRERRWLKGDGYVQGRVYLDGSALDTNWADAAVGAWAVVYLQLQAGQLVLLHPARLPCHQRIREQNQA